MSDLRLLAVDLDGVVADTFWIHEEGWREVARHVGHRLHDEQVSDLRGVPTRDAVMLVVQRLGYQATTEEISALVDTKNLVRDSLVARLNGEYVIEEARRFLRSAHEDPTLTVVCVAASRAAPEMIERLGIGWLLDEVVYGDAVTPPKYRSSGVFERLAGERSLHRRELLVLDDGEAVVQECRRAGIPSIRMDVASAKDFFVLGPAALHAAGLAALTARADS